MCLWGNFWDSSEHSHWLQASLEGSACAAELHAGTTGTGAGTLPSVCAHRGTPPGEQMAEMSGGLFRNPVTDARGHCPLLDPAAASCEMLQLSASPARKRPACCGQPSSPGCVRLREGQRCGCSVSKRGKGPDKERETNPLDSRAGAPGAEGKKYRQR